MVQMQSANAWEELSDQIEDYLTTISLADMMAKEEVKSLSLDHDLRQKKQIKTQ